MGRMTEAFKVNTLKTHDTPKTHDTFEATALWRHPKSSFVILHPVSLLEQLKTHDTLKTH